MISIGRINLFERFAEVSINLKCKTGKYHQHMLSIITQKTFTQQQNQARLDPHIRDQG